MLQASEAVKLLEEAKKTPDYSKIDVSKYLSKIEDYIKSWASIGMRHGNVYLPLNAANHSEEAAAILYNLKNAGYDATYTHPRCMNGEGLVYTFTIEF